MAPLADHPVILKEHLPCSQACWRANDFDPPRGHVSRSILAGASQAILTTRATLIPVHVADVFVQRLAKSASARCNADFVVRKTLQPAKGFNEHNCSGSSKNDNHIPHPPDQDGSNICRDRVHSPDRRCFLSAVSVKHVNDDLEVVHEPQESHSAKHYSAGEHSSYYLIKVPKPQSSTAGE